MREKVSFTNGQLSRAGLNLGTSFGSKSPGEIRYWSILFFTWFFTLVFFKSAFFASLISGFLKGRCAYECVCVKVCCCRRLARTAFQSFS